MSLALDSFRYAHGPVWGLSREVSSGPLASRGRQQVTLCFGSLCLPTSLSFPTSQLLWTLQKEQLVFAPLTHVTGRPPLAALTFHFLY